MHLQDPLRFPIHSAVHPSRITHALPTLPYSSLKVKEKVFFLRNVDNPKKTNQCHYPGNQNQQINNSDKTRMISDSQRIRNQLDVTSY